MGIVTWLAPRPLGAQDRSVPGPLVTDRPDQTESAATVSPGFFQVEVGATRSVTGATGNRIVTFAAGQTLMRIGVLTWLEGRIGFDGWLKRTSTPASADGIGNAAAGAKARLFARPAGPEVAVLGMVTIPFGIEAFRAERVDPEVRLAASYPLAERLALGVNVGATWTGVATGPATIGTETDVFYTGVLGLTMTDRVGGFVEAYGAIAANGNRSSAHAVDGGVTVLVRDALQLDLSAGFGLTGAAEDWFIGAGLSLRVPR